MGSEAIPPLGSVLVAGGCGFLGSHIVSLLVSRFPPSTSSTRVSVLDLTTTRNRYDGVDYFNGDLTDIAAVREVFEKVKPAVIIHTASPTAFASNDILLKVNVQGTQTLLDEAQKVGTVKAFVFTGSASVVSDTRTDLINADEDWSVVTGQGEYYSDTKAQAETIVLSANRPTTNPTFCTAVIRPSSLFGERDVQMIPSSLWVLRTGKTSFQLGNNDNLFDFTYAGNAAHAHLLAAARLLEASALSPERVTALQKAQQDGEANGARERITTVDGEAFFVTNTTPIYFWDFSRALWSAYYNLASAGGAIPAFPPPAEKARIVGRGFGIVIATVMGWVAPLLGRGQPTLTPPKVIYACMTRYFSTQKAQRLLGYQPLWTLQEGIERTAQWFWDNEGKTAEKR